MPPSQQKLTLESPYFPRRINIPFNLLTLTVVSLFFHPKRGRSGSVIARLKSLDLLGCFLFVPGIFMFLLALLTGGQTGAWNTPTVIGLFVGSGVTLALFAAWEWRRGDQAMIPAAVVLRRSVICTCLSAASQLGALTISSYYLPAWFQHVQGVSPLASGVRMLPTVLTQIITTLLVSAISSYPPIHSSSTPQLTNCR